MSETTIPGSRPGGEAPEPRAVLAALGVHDIGAYQRVTGGIDTITWRVAVGGRDHALRLFRADQARAVEREVAAMTAAAAGGLPVPVIRARGVWQERPVLLLDWLPGQTLMAALQATPWRLWALGHAFGAMQARIHALPAPPVLVERSAGWARVGGPAVAALADRLQERAGAGDRLLHLDYHPLNVLTDGRRITAVLDWTNARAGDPRLDAARTYTILLIEPAAGRGWLLGMVRRLLAASWRRGYQSVAGPLGDLALPLAWAGRFMLHDRGPRPERPGVGLSPPEMDAVRRWTEARERRAGPRR